MKCKKCGREIVGSVQRYCNKCKRGAYKHGTPGELADKRELKHNKIIEEEIEIVEEVIEEIVEEEIVKGRVKKSFLSRLLGFVLGLFLILITFIISIIIGFNIGPMLNF